jgi:hypothetical protein
MEPRTSYNQQRWAPCQNVGDVELNAHAAMEYVAVGADDVIAVQQVSDDAIETTCFNSPKTMQPGGYGQCTFDVPFLSQYSGTATTGRLFGPVSGGSSLFDSQPVQGYPLIGVVDAGDQIGLFGKRRSQSDPSGSSFCMRFAGTSIITRTNLTWTGFFAGTNYQGVFEPAAGDDGLSILANGFWYWALSVTWEPVSFLIADGPHLPRGSCAAGWGKWSGLQMDDHLLIYGESRAGVLGNIYANATSGQILRTTGDWFQLPSEPPFPPIPVWAESPSAETDVTAVLALWS